MLPRIFLIYILVLFPACLQGSVPENDFVPNGEGTRDKKLTEKHWRLLFNTPIRFYGKSYDKVYVNYEGAISFESEVSFDNGFCNGERSAYPVVAPFWMNASVKTGKVYYRQIELGHHLEDQLNKPLTAITASFPAFAASNWHQALVVTWHNVSRPNRSDENSVLTAQAIIVTGRNQEEEHDHTFVVFFYDSVPHDPHTTAFLGFDSSYEERFSMQRACANDSIKVEVETNLNKTRALYQIGQYVYRVDVQIDEPGSLCPALSDPSYGYCKTNDYHKNDTAECGCNHSPEKTTVTCVDKEGLYWRGALLECPEYTTTVAPGPETTTDGGSHASPVSFLQTIPILLLTFLVAFYLC